MYNNLKKRNISRKRRVLSNRKKTKGTELRPRLSVNKTNKHLLVQLIDDEQGKTLCGIGTSSKKDKNKKSKESAKEIGRKIAELAKSKKIENIVFDRGRLKYHGIIAELATAAREAGLKF